MQVTEQFTCDIERLLQTVLSAPCSMATLESSAPALPSASNFAYESPVSGLSVDCRRDRSELAIIDASDALCRLLTSLDLRVDDFELISIKV